MQRRLNASPLQCSTEPFAIVTRFWDHANQTIPTSKQSLFERREDPWQRTVNGISLSTDFAHVNTSQHGDISVVLVASSTPGVSNLRQQTFRRSDDCGPQSTMHPGVDCGSLPSGTDATALEALQLPAFNGQISVDLNGTVTGSMNYTVSLSGLLSSIKFSDINLAVALDATIQSTLSINADITGKLSTEQIQLFTIGLPGLDFGKVFTLGPSFSIYGQADASVEADTELDVDISYATSSVQLNYPQSQAINGSITPANSNIKLSAGTDVTAEMQLSAHMIPEIAFGLTVLGQSATISLDLNAYVEADLSLVAAMNGTISPSNSNSTSAGASGCVDIFTGISVDLGAEAHILDSPIGPSKTFHYQTRDYSPSNGHRVPLSFFEQNLRKDYRNPTLKFAALPAVASNSSRTDGKGFSCPTAKVGALAPVLGQTLNATSYQERKS
ncbi:hypothetical protein BD309DRAFT_875012 [Dichomitus squalens]|uniref:DUF7223 domain-containing protein n=2 Tax=Dichomitus squalens TaxID=114155 RepID=A0A4V2K2V4_9APHY|nr:uncharacterized protein DICSQDRAFT_162849 [Dichomitus squalens LYAD-421 SS1]EJF58503.1 hypothetical protein DICSQDRAFT_162849 [Dichomitus squalens LYAD-421 SS1]TBU38133.1 hypothetical protein BD309DRAFT_875012 [Dichomitus squalens]TBU51380.1 hypothetical protein BD310DRAFT_834500 [Dichomitus squalens]